MRPSCPLYGHCDNLLNVNSMQGRKKCYLMTKWRDIFFFGGGGQNKISRNLYFRGPIDGLTSLFWQILWLKWFSVVIPLSRTLKWDNFWVFGKSGRIFLRLHCLLIFPFFFFFSTSPIPGQFHVSFQYSREGKEFSNSRDSSQVVHCSSICSCAVVVNFSRNFMVGAKNNMKSVKWRWQYSLPGLILIPLKREEFL